MSTQVCFTIILLITKILCQNFVQIRAERKELLFAEGYCVEVQRVYWVLLPLNPTETVNYGLHLCLLPHNAAADYNITLLALIALITQFVWPMLELF